MSTLPTIARLARQLGVVTDDDRLVLDSMSVVELVDLIENEIDVVIPAEKIVGSNFASLEAVARLVDSLIVHSSP